MLFVSYLSFICNSSTSEFTCWRTHTSLWTTPLDGSPTLIGLPAVLLPLPTILLVLIH